MATNAASLYHRGRPFRRIYVWELPVRVFHWVNALGILLLIISGYLIGNPFSFGNNNGEPWDQHYFGWIRFTHFAAGYVVLFIALMRLYWGFVGNRYARWAYFLPLNKEQLLDMLDTLKVDILQVKVKGKISVGHNYMAKATYIALFAIFVFMVISGFGLYASMSDSWIPSLFAWIVPLMGSDQAVRHWHHIFMWAFVLFSIIHVYLCVYHDWVEGRGDMSSMVGGWKFDRHDKLADE
jgi:Ni/Fe-hydrogenase 1 B-type cytochrome subunit